MSFTSGLVRLPVQGVRRWGSRRFHQWELRSAHVVAEEPLQVRVEQGVSADALAGGVERLHGSLQLIRDLCPGEHHAVLQNFTCVLVRRGTGAEYWADTRTCVLGADTIASQSPVATALSIIHELGHAKIARRLPGWRSYPEYRIEGACFRAELRFSRRLSAAGWTMTRVDATLKHLIERGYPSSMDRYVRRVARLRAHAAPKWIIRLYSFLRKPTT